jgi:hypothetical protein
VGGKEGTPEKPGRREIASRTRSSKKASPREGIVSAIQNRGRKRSCWIAFSLMFFFFFTEQVL